MTNSVTVTLIVHNSLTSCDLCVSGEVAPKRVGLRNDSQWSLSTTLWLRLLKMPPVWYGLCSLIHQCLSVHACLGFQPHPDSLCVFVIDSLRAMVFAHMCMSSTSYTLLSWLPTYFKESFPHEKVFVSSTI